MPSVSENACRSALPGPGRALAKLAAGAGAALAAITASKAADPSPVGLNQNMLVICVKYADIATTRRTSCQDWVDSMNAEINPFYNQSSFGRTTFNFVAAPGPDNGWYDLGLATTDYDFFRVAQAAVTLADPGVNFAAYDRVAVLTNFAGFGGQGGGPWWWRVNEGSEATIDFGDGNPPAPARLMTMSITNEWLADAGYGSPYGAGALDDGNTVTAHEIGHQLGMPTHYADVRWSTGLSRDVVTPWDIMGLSPTMNHFVGWAKAQRNFTQAGFVRTIGPPVGSNINQLVRLRPVSRTPSGTDTQVIKIPLSNSPVFTGYVVELRRQVNGDNLLPSAGVLVSYVDERPDTILKLVTLEDPSMPGDMNQAPLDLGETYTDPGYNLSITYESNAGEDANVRIQYNLPASSRPNPSIMPWGAPPWETPDIWIDSERNGWGSYRYTDGAGNPAGNGDDAWVGHVNRVMVRVRNSGPGLATNVRAQVFVNSPPGMGDAGANWDYLGTIVFPSIGAGLVAQDFINWTPSVGQHTCIKVVLVATPGELSESDNLAQENVSAFDTSSGSPFEPVSLKVTVNNPFAEQSTPVRYHLRDVPEGWGFRIEPMEAELPAGGSSSVRVTLYPSGLPGDKEDGRMQELRRKTTQIGFLARPKLEAQIPYADTYVPIGGVEVWTHLVDRTRLTCRIGDIANPQNRPTLDPRLKDLRPTLKNLGDQVPLDGAVRKGVAGAVSASRAIQEQLAARLPKDVVVGGKGEIAPQVAEARKLLGATSLIRPEPEPMRASANSPVVVAGELTPAVAGAAIAVEMRAAGGEGYVQLTKTDSAGRYVLRMKPLGSGEAVVRAHFAGDNRRGAAESGDCRVIVQ